MKGELRELLTSYGPIGNLWWDGGWETCMTMKETWGYAKNDTNWKSAQDLTRKLIDIASKGGNFLLNVGPTTEGIFPDAINQRLEQIGAWMRVNGECIYGNTKGPVHKFPYE